MKQNQIMIIISSWDLLKGLGDREIFQKRVKKQNKIGSLKSILEVNLHLDYYRIIRTVTTKNNFNEVPYLIFSGCWFCVCVCVWGWGKEG